VARLWPACGPPVAHLWPACGLPVARLWPACGPLVARLQPACSPPTARLRLRRAGYWPILHQRNAPADSGIGFFSPAAADAGNLRSVIKTQFDDRCAALFASFSKAL